MSDYPNVHETRNRPTRVGFSDEYVFIYLADGRAIGMPLYFFPWLRDASDEERKDCELYPFSVFWRDLDEGIDIIAMVSGMYIKEKRRPVAALEKTAATPT